jgi:hypothetical protein
MSSIQTHPHDKRPSEFNRSVCALSCAAARIADLGSRLGTSACFPGRQQGTSIRGDLHGGSQGEWVSGQSDDLIDRKSARTADILGLEPNERRYQDIFQDPEQSMFRSWNHAVTAEFRCRYPDRSLSGGLLSHVRPSRFRVDARKHAFGALGIGKRPRPYWRRFCVGSDERRPFSDPRTRNQIPVPYRRDRAKIGRKLKSALRFEASEGACLSGVQALLQTGENPTAG